MQTDEPQIPSLFVYLSGQFNAQQFYDFYWIIVRLQREYEEFMTRKNSKALGLVCKKVKDE